MQGQVAPFGLSLQNVGLWTLSLCSAKSLRSLCEDLLSDGADEPRQSLSMKCTVVVEAVYCIGGGCFRLAQKWCGPERERLFSFGGWSVARRIRKRMLIAEEG